MLITWLCWFNWLLKVTVRFAAALGVLLLPKTFFPFSKALQRRLQMSMFWKQDFTLDGGGSKAAEHQSPNSKNQRPNQSEIKAAFAGASKRFNEG